MGGGGGGEGGGGGWLVIVFLLCFVRVMGLVSPVFLGLVWYVVLFVDAFHFVHLVPFYKYIHLLQLLYSTGSLFEFVFLSFYFQIL